MDKDPLRWNLHLLAAVANSDCAATECHMTHEGCQASDGSSLLTDEHATGCWKFKEDPESATGSAGKSCGNPDTSMYSTRLVKLPC